LSLVLLAWASLAAAAGPIGTPTPPPAPEVAPVISGSYPIDLDGNRISDELEQGATGNTGLSIASAETVEVELIFSEPVTQRQIDEFLLLGGEITYIYQAVSYGWNGSILRQSIDLLPSVLGPALVQVEAVQQVQYCMDTATQVARVAPSGRRDSPAWPTVCAATPIRPSASSAAASMRRTPTCGAGASIGPTSRQTGNPHRSIMTGTTPS
jgi:hypothetical protein